MAKSRVDQLVAQIGTVKHEALKGALEQHLQQEKEAQEQRLLAEFNEASGVLQSRVENLKIIRASERDAVKRVKAADKAFEQFKLDGDFAAFRKAIAQSR